MHRTIRTIRATLCSVAITGLALALSSCSEAVDRVDEAVDQTYEVTYEVTGENVDSIEFHGGGGKAMEPKTETVSKPELPWRKTVTLRGIMPAAVMPVAADPEGARVTCKIIHKGKVLDEQSAEGLVTAGGCTAESPVTG
ncbi:MmpS family transport accessory protein [Streptomyces dubilierae]|uniref:MmpS family transport accessory protein n=1 Tax=Streptomyces dubilierae TaxID=3075533 RepID=A0ABU2PBA5_9ACTN|nr:MmpS family transport accessory protein [Streptomyces sp. DSM 41921]MDT0389441.1 MmpS family transport accessory protein [Streptomyces sp. DSM 41921]